MIDSNDGAFAVGSIGFGSFNSQACFDDVNITGARADPSFYIDAFDDGNDDAWRAACSSRICAPENSCRAAGCCYCNKGRCKNSAV